MKRKHSVSSSDDEDQSPKSSKRQKKSEQEDGFDITEKSPKSLLYADTLKRLAQDPENEFWVVTVPADVSFNSKFY